MYTAWDNSYLISSAGKRRTSPAPKAEKESIPLRPFPPTSTTSSDSDKADTSDADQVDTAPRMELPPFIPPPPIAVYTGRKTSTGPARDDVYTKAEVDKMFQAVLRTMSRQADIVDNMKVNQQSFPEDDDLPFETQCRYTTAQINDIIRRMAGRIDRLAREVGSLRQRLDAEGSDSDSSASTVINV